MTQNRSILALALVFAGVAVALVFLGIGPGQEPSSSRAEVSRLEAGEQVGSAAQAPVELSPAPQVRLSQAEMDDTTVLWPVGVKLELQQASYLPTREGVAPIGSGRRSILTGRITDGNDEPAQSARVVFTHGPNASREITCDSEGRFGASDLFPGLSIVVIRGVPGVTAEREVRLRQGKETLLNLGFGRPAAVFGTVVDRKGEGLEGARVSFDGNEAYSQLDGEFYLPQVAAGQVIVEVSLEGYATHRELVYVTGGKVIPKGRLQFALEPAAALTVSVPDRVGGPGPVQVYLFSGQARDPARTFPWYRLNPIEIEAGSAKSIEGLPSKLVKVHAFRSGARIPTKVVSLRADRPQNLVLSLSPSPKLTGRVTRDGEPEVAALVRLQAPDEVKASLNYFQQPSYYLESGVLPLLPPAHQETFSDEKGEFAFSAWAETSGVRFLEARSADGLAWAGRLVDAGDETVELALEEVDLGNSTLALTFPGRWQGLPIELSINGRRFDRSVLPPHEPLVVSELPSGRWKLSVDWHGNPIRSPQIFRIEGRFDQDIDLPQEAIDGQDEEAWRRAGREFPFN